MSTRWMAVLGTALLVAATVLGGDIVATPAQAAGLPTWADVQAAKQNQAAAAAKVAEIKNLIAQGQAELQRLQDESAKAGEKANEAELAFQNAAAKSDQLDAEAAESQKQADEAAGQAAALVSQMYRSGGVDRNLELFLESDGSTADALLERLASMSKATERNTGLSQEAQQAMNTAASLGEQAKVARQERETLSAEAKQAAELAAQAAAAQQSKVETQQAQQEDLKVKLAALQDKTTATVAGYQERQRIEAEAARKAAEEAAKNGGGGGPSSAGGGWVKPMAYIRITTYFRAYSPYQSGGHTGIDLSSGRCGTQIVAGQSGTVTYAGYHDNMGGNMVYINHAGNMQTRYAHMNGVFYVRSGQSVSAGQPIGQVGATGAALGCHLHYEVLRNGSFINPINYL